MLVHNATILTMNEKNAILEDGAIYVEGDIIRDVGHSQEILAQYPDSALLDARGKILIPGLINAHMHLYSTFARGIVLKDEPPENFLQILKQRWWRLDKALDGEAVYLSAIIPLVQAIRCGTTTIIDHHSSPSAIERSLDIIADLFEQIGTRGILCYEVSDRNGKDVCNRAIEENVRFLERCVKSRSPLLRGLFGLHASFTLGDETLKRCVDAACPFNTGFHVHCAEAASDLEYARKNYGKTVVERFADAGILGPKTIAAHCVHITDRDIAILEKTQTNVVHNPRSNMNNGVGCAPVLKMLKRGVRVGLGTDGMSASMWNEVKVANLLHKHQRGDPRPGSAESSKMLFKNNALIASDIFGTPIGVIEEGAMADFILVDYCPPTPMTPENLTGHILFGIADAPVDTTVVGGKILMREKKLVGIDEEAICARAREVAKEVWRRF